MYDLPHRSLELNATATWGATVSSRAALDLAGMMTDRWST